MQRFSFQPERWYWKVGDSGSIYSSASNSYVTADDTTYVAWVALGLVAPAVASEADIWKYVQPFQPDWMFNGTTFSQPTPTTYSKAQLKAYSASVRYKKETGGTTVNGTIVATDRESQSMLNGAFNMAMKDSTFTTQWKGADGTFTQLNASAINALASGVGAHVSVCFAKEAEVAAAIDGGTVISLPVIAQAFAGIV
jgi:hypothetical protein